MWYYSRAMRSPTLFLFDLDGTLVTTGGAGMRALGRAFDDVFGIPDAHHRIDPAGKTDPAIFRELFRLLDGRDMRAEELPEISEKYLTYLADEMLKASAKAFPGVNEILDHLAGREGAIVALGTGNLERGARLKLAPANLNRHFDFGGFGSDAEDRADVLRAGHQRGEARAGCPIPPGNVIVIGDTVLDIRAARRAGFRAVGVATGRTSLATLRAEQPDFAMQDMTGAFDLLDFLEGRPAAVGQ